MTRLTRPPVLVLLVLLPVLVLPTPASAHNGGIGFSEITVEGDTVGYDLYLNLSDLTALGDHVQLRPEGDVAVDEAGDLLVTNAEVARLVREGLSVQAGGRSAEPELIDVRRTDLTKVAHLVEVERMEPVPLLSVRLRYTFDQPVADLRVIYDLFLEGAGREPHANVAWLHLGGGTSTFVFAPDSAELTPERATPLIAPASGPPTAPADARPSRLPVVPVALIAGLAVSATTVVLLARRRRGLKV